MIKSALQTSKILSNNKLHDLNKLSKLYTILYNESYCNNLDIKLVFPSFKIHNMLIVKDPVPVKIVYQIVCAGCNACYLFRKHLTICRERDSPSFQHLFR